MSARRPVAPARCPAATAHCPVVSARRPVAFRRRAALLLLGGLSGYALACAPPGTAGGGPGQGLGARHAYWRSDDRVLVTGFRELGAVAADGRYVFAAGEHGVLVYDHRFQRWEAPLTVEDGFPRADPPIALEVDELSGVLWMVTRTGALWAYDVPLRNDWRWIGVLPGGATSLVAHEGALWARTSSGWFMSAGSGSPPARVHQVPAGVRNAAASGLQRLEQESAAFRSAGSSLTVDEYLRRWEITGAAPSPDPGLWWLSTWGGGLYAYDDRMLDAQPLRFGSVGRGVSAIAPGAGDGLWFGGDGMGRYRGVAHAGPELRDWTWHEAGREGAPNGTVYAIAEAEIGVFVGAHDGLYRLTGERWDRATDAQALPSSVVRALAVGGGAVWAGTDRGLARLTPAANGALDIVDVRATTGVRVNALAVADSLLWIATDRGLLALHPGSGAVARAPVDEPRLRGRVVGVAYDDDRDVLHALAESALLAYDGSQWTVSMVGASLARIGRVAHVAVRDGVVWIAGATGVIALDPVGGAETLLSVPRDIPEGPVRQVMPVAGGVWLATPAGALYIRLD